MALRDEGFTGRKSVSECDICSGFRAGIGDDHSVCIRAWISRDRGRRTSLDDAKRCGRVDDRVDWGRRIVRIEGVAQRGRSAVAGIICGEDRRRVDQGAGSVGGDANRDGECG